MRCLAWGLLVLGTACGTSRQAVSPAPPGRESVAAPRRYQHPELGFELTCPSADWLLTENSVRSPEGALMPVILRHRTTGAQVLLQVAPAVSTPTRLAERLIDGLRLQRGFTTGEPEPLPLSDSAVGFDFSVEDAVRGRVALREGRPGHLLMLLATWPSTAPEEVPRGVDALFQSIRPLPEGG